jgi:transposase InsO family protein
LTTDRISSIAFGVLLEHRQAGLESIAGDWTSRAVLAWRLSNTMDSSFCVDALEEALARFGQPEIFNTD